MRLLRLALLTALAASPAFIALRAQEVVPTSALPAGSTTGFLKAGDVAPEFSVLGPKGETIKLSDYRGKIVIVDISATWCGPCQAAMPNNDRVFKKYAGQGVVLLGVTADDSREAYDGWIKHSVGKYTFTMAFDPLGKDGWKDSVFNTGYHVTGFPTMFVIGHDGKILETVSGGGPGEDYRLEYALARAGVKVDLASIPAEPKKDPAAPKAIPMMAKTAAIPMAGKTAGASVPMMGMGGAPAGGFIPGKFGSLASGDTVTDFTVTGADDQPVKLSDFRGKTLLLQFNTSNGPQPWIAELASAYKDQGLAVLAIFSATDRTDFDAWRAKNPHPPFAIAWDPAGKSWAEGVTNTGFGVGMFPATIVIDAAGKLVSGTIGMGPRVALLVKGMLAKSKGVKLTAEDAAPVLEALLTADAIKAAAPSATLKPMPGAAGGMTPAVRIPTLAAGAVAPDFPMKDIAGKDVRLADFKGKIVILDFWATWCGPCLASFPHTQEVAAKYKDQDVVVLASGTSDTIKAFKKWIPTNQSKYADLLFAFDPNERGSATFEDRASNKLYHVVGIPTQFIIGRDGKIAATLVGYDTGDARAEATLAKLGVKVDPAIVAAGEKQLARDAADAITQAAAAKDAEKNPPAPFKESFGKLTAGATVPDFDLLAADGKTVKFSDYAKGKTAVIGLWSAGFGPPDEMGKQWDALAKKYGAAGVVFIGIGGFQAREAFDGWLAKNPGKYSFVLTSDPAGGPPKAPKPTAEMNPEEKKAYGALSKAYYDSVVPMKLGGIITPVPTTLVVNPEGKLVGWSAGFGPVYPKALANLLLRAGVKLAAEDMPAKVYAANETKEAPPEARIELLKVGAPAPDFTTTDINGKEIKLSDYRGKVVILDFWATWCGPCIASMPHTNEVASTYRDQGVVVLGSCTSDTRGKFDSWVKANQEKYPDFIFSHDAAERGETRVSRKLYGVSGIPTQFIIGRDGKVAAHSIGYLKGEVLLEAALAKAGIKVDAAILAKAVEDQKKRDER